MLFFSLFTDTISMWITCLKRFIQCAYHHFHLISVPFFHKQNKPYCHGGKTVRNCCCCSFASCVEFNRCMWNGVSGTFKGASDNSYVLNHIDSFRLLFQKLVICLNKGQIASRYMVMRLVFGSILEKLLIRSMDRVFE